MSPFCVTINGNGDPRILGGLVDGEPVAAGEIVQVRTTGGGGWGDPLEREAELVCQDVVEGRVSRQAAQEAYGVVVQPGRDADDWQIDLAATMALRDKMRLERGGSPVGMIDRGPGYLELLNQSPKGV